jgi:hypothetical protein
MAGFALQADGTGRKARPRAAGKRSATATNAVRSARLPRSIAESLSTPNAMNTGFSFAAFIHILSIAETKQAYEWNRRGIECATTWISAARGRAIAAQTL